MMYKNHDRRAVKELDLVVDQSPLAESGPLRKYEHYDLSIEHLG